MDKYTSLMILIVTAFVLVVIGLMWGWVRILDNDSKIRSQEIGQIYYKISQGDADSPKEYTVQPYSRWKVGSKCRCICN